MSDKETLAVYAAQADKYADMIDNDGVDKTLVAFMGTLAHGAKVLDWGCGPGNATAFMRNRGLDVISVDASPEFAAKADQLYGIKVRVETFADLKEVDVYDGIWANFSLLHAPKADMPAHLAAAHRALKPDGQLSIALKIGDGEERDSIGRFYAYYQEDELMDLLAQAGFTVTGAHNGDGVGLAGENWPWIAVRAHA